MTSPREDRAPPTRRSRRLCRGPAYDTYRSTTHALCNAYALRELQAATDQSPPGQWCWAGQVADARARYRSAVRIGAAATADRTTKLQARHHAPARRLSNRVDDYLRFTTDPQISFDNNAAEREIWVIKLRQKVSAVSPGRRSTGVFMLLGSVTTGMWLSSCSGVGGQGPHRGAGGRAAGSWRCRGPLPGRAWCLVGRVGRDGAGDRPGSSRSGTRNLTVLTDVGPVCPGSTTSLAGPAAGPPRPRLPLSSASPRSPASGRTSTR